MSRFLRAFGPMLLWMAFVFFMSTDAGSATRTGRILGPLLRWLVPSISAESVEEVHFLVRKAGHVIEFGILAVLILRGIRILQPTTAKRWSWPVALIAVAAAAAYGASDELHQGFVASRGASATDVLIDACGAALGVLIAYVWTRGGGSKGVREGAREGPGNIHGDVGRDGKSRSAGERPRKDSTEES